jgi:hypothetical protein
MQGPAGIGVHPVEEPAEVARPSWVNARPVDDFNYIGIGLSPKSRPDYQEAAKKNALNDLASEISVKVEGNSLLYTLDRKYQFDEQFTSTINTKTSEQLEGFELVDSWENGTEYWTYYRLSKAEHARIKAEKKRQALAQATDFFARSRTSLTAGDLKSAIDQDLRALLAIKEYWGESDMVEINGSQVALANEIYNDLQRLTSGVRISILPERCALGYGDHYRRELMITAEYESGGGSHTLVQTPLTIEYPGNSGKVTESRGTDAEGRVRTTVQHVQLGALSPEVLVKLDLNALVSPDLDPTFVKPLVGSLTIPERRAPIDLTMPRVFMQASEANMGHAVGEAGVATALRAEMTRNGFRFVDRESDADMVMKLTAATREGGDSNGFYTAFLDVSLSVRDRITGDVIHEGGRQGLKGVQLNYEKAGLDAYKKAVQEMKKDVAPALLAALL